MLIYCLFIHHLCYNALRSASPYEKVLGLKNVPHWLSVKDLTVQDVGAGKLAPAGNKNTMSWVFSQLFSQFGGNLRWQVSK